MNYTFRTKNPPPVPPPPNMNMDLDVLLLRENIREYDRIVDDVVRRAKAQANIVKEWDREMEKQRDTQYRLMFDDVIREIQYRCKVYNGPLQI